MTRRILRIVPLYWFLTTVALIVLVVAPQLFTTHYRGIDLSSRPCRLPLAVPGR